MRYSLPPLFENRILFVPATKEEDQKKDTLLALLRHFALAGYEVCLCMRARDGSAPCK